MRMQIDESSGQKKNEIFDSRRFKTRLLVSLTELSRKAQQSSNHRPTPQHATAASPPPPILAVEDDGLEYIENIIFDLFNAILLANSDFDTFGSGNTPEALCSAAIASISVKNVTSVGQSTASPKLNKKGQPVPPASNQIVLNDSSFDLNEIEQRVRQIFPRGLADAACSKAQNTVNECRKFISSTKKSRLFRNLR